MDGYPSNMDGLNGPVPLAMDWSSSVISTYYIYLLDVRIRTKIRIEVSKQFPIPTLNTIARQLQLT